MAFPTRVSRPTDPPRAARRSKFWVGTTDRPTHLGRLRGQRTDSVARPTECSLMGEGRTSDVLRMQMKSKSRPCCVNVYADHWSASASSPCRPPPKAPHVHLGALRYILCSIVIHNPTDRPAARSAAIKKSGRASRPTDPPGHSLAPANRVGSPDRPTRCMQGGGANLGRTDRPTDPVRGRLDTHS